MEDKVMAECRRHFRSRILNRVDDAIIFQSLDEEELARIVEIQIGPPGKTACAQQTSPGRGRRREKTVGQGRLRPTIWRPPAETRHSGTFVESALHAPAGGRIQAGR